MERAIMKYQLWQEEGNFTPTQLSSMILGQIMSYIVALNIEIIAICISTAVYFTTVHSVKLKKQVLELEFKIH